jgi:CubicO group peptidase (beta-lactamase class C family)
MMDQGYSLQEMHRFHRQIDGLNWQFGGEKMRYNFLHRSEFLPHAVVSRGEAASLIVSSPRADLGEFVVNCRLGNMTLDEYIQKAPVNGVILLHHGRSVYERYPRMRPFDQHLLMSVSKVFTSLAVAQLEAQGLVNLQQRVEFFLPELKGSGWEGTPVQDVLDMASGIDAPEEEDGFVNPEHPYYQYEASLGWLPKSRRTPFSTYRYMTKLKRKDPPGQVYEYTSVNTFLLAWLAESLSGLSLPELIAQRTWSPMGAEADGLLAISKFGAPAAHGGLCARLRDVARLGLLFTNSGGERGKLAIPVGYLAKIQTAGRAELFDRGPTGPVILERLHGEHPRHQVDQWDYVLADGDFFKSGYGGQGLYISPTRELVAAFFGTPFDEAMEIHEMEWITRQMVKAGLFDEDTQHG